MACLRVNLEVGENRTPSFASRFQTDLNRPAFQAGMRMSVGPLRGEHTACRPAGSPVSLNRPLFPGRTAKMSLTY